MTQPIFYVHSTYAGPGLAYAVSNVIPSENAEKLLPVKDIGLSSNTITAIAEKHREVDEG